MAPYRQDLSTANVAAGTMTGAHAGTQQLGAAAQRRAGLLQRANGLAVGGQSPPITAPQMPPDPATEMRSMTGGGLQAPMSVDSAMVPTPPRSFNPNQPEPVPFGHMPDGLPPPEVQTRPLVQSFDPGTAQRPAGPTLGGPMPSPDPLGAAMPGRAPAPVAGDPGMSAFQSAMQTRAATAPTFKPVGARPAPRGPSTLSDVYRGGRMKPLGGNVRPPVGDPPQVGGSGMGGKQRAYRRPMGR